MEPIAETVVRCVYPDGSRQEVRLSIGKPFAHPDGDWACETAIEGLRIGKVSKVVGGVDSWQALLLATRFLRELITQEVQHGAELHWPDGAAIGVHEFFCTRTASES